MSIVVARRRGIARSKMSLHRTDPPDEPFRDEELDREDPSASRRRRSGDLDDEVQVTLAARNRPPYRPLEAEFDVEERIGEGAFGVVYRAIERSTGRLVAVKRLHPRRRDGALERLQLELSAIVKLRHPHIVQLYRAARDDQGLYLVFEWAAGGSLADRLRDGARFSEREVLAIAEKLGSALEYAHDPRHGVVHCDIKPANILLTDSGEPMLADFGLAISPSDAQPTTSSGGTMLYAAPEQWNNLGNDAAPIDGRADLYALGKTLYHLATGKPPASVLLDRELPRSLRRLIGKCVEQSPADRFADAAAFLVELRRSRDASLAGAMGRDAADWLSPRMRKGLALFAGGVIVVVGGLAFALREGATNPVANALASQDGFRFVLAEGDAGVSVEPGAMGDDTVRMRGGGVLRLQLRSAGGTIAAREIRIRSEALDEPLRIDAGYYVPIVVPAVPGEYLYRATTASDAATDLARIRILVER